MSIFAWYFASQLLSKLGWPRKLGRFKGQAYDAVMVDMAFAQSMDCAAGLGAGRPRLALQLLADIHQGGWEDDAPDIVGMGRRLKDKWSATTSPREAYSLPNFAADMSAISVEQFNSQQSMVFMEPNTWHALVWGLINPGSFEAWYESQMADFESSAPEAISARLEIDETMPSLQEFYENSEQIVRDYERDVGPLPSIPPRLLADAEALGWRV